MAGSGKGTIVLVHGAWCDASVWTKVLMPLAHEGFGVRAAQIPLETFAGDVAAVRRLLEQVEGPVLLVGHSYAGTVVSAAGNHEKVKALAYVCALVPDEGEVFGAIMSMNPAAEQLNLTPDAEGYLWLNAEFAGKALGHDLHRGVLNLAVTTQKPTHGGLFAERLEKPAWKSKPSSYLVTTEDHILAPKTQHALVERLGARVEEVAASHLVVLSQPEAVAQFLRTSAEAMVG